MSQESEIKKIHMGLTTDVTLTQAQTYNIWERRRMTIAVHQVPVAPGPLAGMLKIYGSIIDKDGWYAELGSVNLNTAVEVTSHFDYPNSITTGAAVLYLRFVTSGLRGGYVDIVIHEAED